MRYDVPSLEWSLFGLWRVEHARRRTNRIPVPCCGDDVHHFAARRRRDHDERALDRVGELDRVVGGGFIAGSTTLLFGEPGVGKSTLALMSLRELAADATPVLLIAARSQWRKWPTGAPPR